MATRYDKVSDPAIQASLLLARRGQAYFSRKLNELPDHEFDRPSLLSGWSRAHVVAHVGYNARSVARLVEWARTGVENPAYTSDSQRQEEIDFGSTLPVQALRHLSDHAAIHLSVEWRDLEPEAWFNEVTTAQGRVVPATETLWIRTREVWIHAVDLNNGGRFRDFPPEFIDLLLPDLVKVWARKRTDPQAPNIVLVPTDRPLQYGIEHDSREHPRLVVTGPAADLCQWGTGRGRPATVTLEDGSPAPIAPTWL